MLSEPTGQATTEVLCTASHFPQGVLGTQGALFTLENLLTEEAQAGLWALASLMWGLLPPFTALVIPGSPGLALSVGLAFRCQLLSVMPTYPCVQENTWLWQCITDGFPSQYCSGSLGLWVKIYDVLMRSGMLLLWGAGSWVQADKSTWCLLGTLKDRSCLEKSHELRVNHSQKKRKDSNKMQVMLWKSRLGMDHLQMPSGWQPVSPSW